MKLQNISLSMMNTGIYAGKVAKIDEARADSERNHKKVNNQNLTGISLSANSQFEKMVENIREQMQKVNENDYYDADTKKSKIEELEKQLEEIEKMKTEQLKESMTGSRKKPEKNNSGSSKKMNDNSADNGVKLDLSINAKALIEADNSLKNIKDTNSMRVQLKGSAKVLESDIKMDKGRGVDTKRKEKQLSGIKEGIEKSTESLGEAIKSANKASRDMAENAASTVEQRDEIPQEERDDSDYTKSMLNQ